MKQYVETVGGSNMLFIGTSACDGEDPERAMVDEDASITGTTNELMDFNQA